MGWSMDPGPCFVYVPCVHIMEPTDFETVYRAEGKYPGRITLDFFVKFRKRRGEPMDLINFVSTIIDFVWPLIKLMSYVLFIHLVWHPYSDLQLLSICSGVRKFMGADKTWTPFRSPPSGPPSGAPIYLYCDLENQIWVEESCLYFPKKLKCYVPVKLKLKHPPAPTCPGIPRAFDASSCL